MKKGTTFDYYSFKNNTCITDEKLYSFVNRVIASCFNVLCNSFCKDFKGNLRIGIFEAGSKNDEPAFEMEFTCRKHYSMEEIDFEKFGKGDILFSSFDVSNNAFGLIQVALCYKNENGDIDGKSACDSYMQIDKLLKDVCNEFRFDKYESNAPD